MKKAFCILLVLMLGLVGETSARGTDGSIAKPDFTQRKADIDLTRMSAIMAYAEAQNLVVSPRRYEGKCVKVKGVCSIATSPKTQQTYYSILVPDAGACCYTEQGIDFVLSEQYYQPEDYPQDGETVSVIGMFEMYQKGDYMYCRLQDSWLEMP